MIKRTFYSQVFFKKRQKDIFHVTTNSFSISTAAQNAAVQHDWCSFYDYHIPLDQFYNTHHVHEKSIILSTAHILSIRVNHVFNLNNNRQPSIISSLQYIITFTCLPGNWHSIDVTLLEYWDSSFWIVRSIFTGIRPVNVDKISYTKFTHFLPIKQSTKLHRTN